MTKGQTKGSDPLNLSKDANLARVDCLWELW